MAVAPKNTAKKQSELCVASWNVNGLRSVAKKGLQSWLESASPDVVMFQEVKASPEHLEGIPGLLGVEGLRHAAWAEAEKAGYSGCLTLSKAAPDQVVVGLGKPEYDREGRWLETHFGSWVFINSYFPNSQRDHARLPYKLKFCADAAKRLESLRTDGRSVILAGDINVAHTEIDLANPKTNRDNAGFLPEEREWFDSFMSLGWVDLFRQFQKDGGHYTWWSYRPGVRERNIGWRLDHMFANPEAAHLVTKMWHQPEVAGSDHCPIMARVSFSPSP